MEMTSRVASRLAARHVEHFSDKVREDVSTTAREGDEQLLHGLWIGFWSSLEGQRHQTEPGHPTFGARFQTLQQLRGERASAGRLEEGLDLCQGKAQVNGTEFSEVKLSAQARQGRWGGERESSG